MKKEKKNVGAIIPEIAVVYKETGTKHVKELAKETSVKAMAHGAFRRLTYFVLRRSPIDLLDQAVKEKTGKVHPRAAHSRGHAQGWNEGFQAAIDKYRKKGYWL